MSGSLSNCFLCSYLPYAMSSFTVFRPYAAVHSPSSYVGVFRFSSESACILNN